MSESKVLTYQQLKSAVAGSAAAFRLNLRLEAVSPKVFPPTYEGGKYATETRRINGQDLPCVLLDSVPSQANRMELALQEASEAGEIKFPVIKVDFTAIDNPAIPHITSLQAPHRIADAILRDSTFGDEKTSFRKSKIGKELDQLSNANATPLLTYAPHCLVFGMWDSTGPRGGLGVKFARSIVSEIYGVNAVLGVKTSSRIDPINLRVSSGVLFQSKEGGWTVDEALAVKDKNKKPVKLGKDGKPSEANHGNVTPTITDGGYTIDYAEQTTVISLPALRRLRFPIGLKNEEAMEANIAARTFLAAVGLLGATLAVESGYDLRSRCLLRAKDAIVWTLLGRPGDADQTFTLSKDETVKLYRDSLEQARQAKLPIETNEIVLQPTAGMITLVKKSMELAAAEVSVED